MKSPNFALLSIYESATTLTVSISITPNKADLLYYSMNQDSDKNENRRDGDNDRSFGRREDGRTNKTAGGVTNR